MRRSVYKHELNRYGTTGLFIARDAKVVHVGEQDGNVFLWQESDQENYDSIPRHFHIFGTGHTMPEDNSSVRFQHVGTVQMTSGLVWHVYEEVRH